MPASIERTYGENAVQPTTVAAFDTDHTIDYARGVVPLDHVISLAEDPHTSVWATGFNQSLRERARVPGMKELKQKLGVDDTFVARPRRMKMLKRWIPNADRYYVVDDVDLSQLEPDWDYYTPWGYARDVLGLDVPDGDIKRRSRLPWSSDQIPEWAGGTSGDSEVTGGERG